MKKAAFFFLVFGLIQVGGIQVCYSQESYSFDELCHDGYRPIPEEIIKGLKDLREKDLSCIDFKRFNFRGSDLSGAFFHGSDLRRARLLGVKSFEGTDFHGALVSWVTFLRLVLFGADLSGAIHSGIDLERRNLEWGTLKGETLNGETLKGETLNGDPLWKNRGLMLL